MLKLQRIELLGFKSFSDKGEIVVHDDGVTAIVGPNGCGKSNVSDAIAWVLGEQSAKSLRGEKMEDVIFNGSRNRAPMGMAEVSITLSDTSPEPVEHAGNGNGNGNGAGNGNGNGNGNGSGNGHPRQITVQRRLYRSGESVYMMNGRACRLRDIQDIFLGTGLGPNSYAIIEQGRVGQLLSSKPMDRRALIEEAAGITKFKAKRKLAESRLEAARLNLSRVNDILAEVDRQRNSLKRQAGKARRFIELRNRMRDILSAVFSTRADLLVQQQESVDIALASIGDEGKRLETEIESLNILVHQRRSEVEGQEQQLQEARIRHSEVELEHEKAVQRIERFEDQIRSLEERKTALTAERARIAEELGRNQIEQSAGEGRLAELEKGRLEVAGVLEELKSSLADLNARRDAEERAIGEQRKRQFDAVGNEARIRNEIISRQDMIQRISAQSQRLEREAGEARDAGAHIQEQLTAAREEHSVRETGMTHLKRRLAEAEQTLVGLKAEHAAGIKAAAEAKSREEAIRHRLNTIGELAVRRAYSTESVQQFFNYVRQSDREPLGILADFVEVESDCEAIVEDFLRSELQYVVVQDLSQAQRALTIVKDHTKGRLDCFVLNGNMPFASPEPIAGATPLANVLRFDERVKHFAQTILDAYVVDTVDRAWELAQTYPLYRFIVRTGEVICDHVIGWGEHEALGPLSLKREIRELDRSMDLAGRETAARESDVARFAELVRETEDLHSQLASELQEMEKTILTMDHHVRGFVADLSHAEQRLNVALTELERFAEETRELERTLAEAQAQLNEIATVKSAIEEDIRQRSIKSEELRIDAENQRRELSETQSNLAVLEERRSTANRELNALRQQAADLERRGVSAETQIREAEGQQDQTRNAIQNLDETRYELARERDRLNDVIAEGSSRLEELRRDMHEAEQKWDETRGLLTSWKDRNNELEIEKTQVEADLKHLAGSCFSELNETIESVCLKYFETLPPEELEVREQEYREIREKMDSMGAVNMMAVEEHQEAEERFVFLSTQRQDLLDSIRDTAQAIEEIDSVCRRQFREAFDAINSGFTEAFIHLFGGGHGELRLLDEAGESDAGVEIIAQPPGKRLQNVLLLSGGEKALTALALLISLFRYKPSPFCVLDEVDAPLDDANVDRFANMVREMSKQTQFIIITHSKRTMETASTLYGVTMEEPGISKIVSVRLN